MDSFNAHKTSYGIARMDLLKGSTSARGFDATHTCTLEAIAASVLPVGPDALGRGYGVLTFAAPESAAVGLRERPAEDAALDHQAVPSWVEAKLRRRTVVGIRRRVPLRNAEDGRLIDGISRGDEYALGEL